MYNPSESIQGRRRSFRTAFREDTAGTGNIIKEGLKETKDGIVGFTQTLSQETSAGVKSLDNKVKGKEAMKCEVSLVISKLEFAEVHLEGGYVEEVKTGIMRKIKNKVLSPFRGGRGGEEVQVGKTWEEIVATVKKQSKKNPFDTDKRRQIRQMLELPHLKSPQSQSPKSFKSFEGAQSVGESRSLSPIEPPKNKFRKLNKGEASYVEYGDTVEGYKTINVLPLAPNFLPRGRYLPALDAYLPSSVFFTLSSDDIGEGEVKTQPFLLMRREVEWFTGGIKDVQHYRTFSEVSSISRMTSAGSGPGFLPQLQLDNAPALRFITKAYSVASAGFDHLVLGEDRNIVLSLRHFPSNVPIAQFDMSLERMLDIKDAGMKLNFVQGSDVAKKRWGVKIYTCVSANHPPSGVEWEEGDTEPPDAPRGHLPEDDVGVFKRKIDTWNTSRRKAMATSWEESLPEKVYEPRKMVPQGETFEGMKRDILIRKRIRWIKEAREAEDQRRQKVVEKREKRREEKWWEVDLMRFFVLTLFAFVIMECYMKSENLTRETQERESEVIFDSVALTVEPNNDTE